MAIPNGPDKAKSGGDAHRQDDTPNNSLHDSHAKDNYLSSTFSPASPSLSPDVESQSRAASSQDLLLTPKGPRCNNDLQTGPMIIEYKSGIDIFAFPTPSPRLLTPTPRESSRFPPRSTSFRHRTSDRRHGAQETGMAIGSQSHEPASWGRSQTADCISTKLQQQPSSDALPAAPARQANGTTIKQQERTKKISSWKLFSNLFKKASKPTPVTKDPIYRENLERPCIQPTAPPPSECDTFTPTLPHSATFPAARPVSSRQSHTRTLSDSKAQPRCESRSSVRTSFTRMLRSPCEMLSPSLSPWRESFFGDEQVQPNMPMLHPDSATVPRTPRLELDLPEPELERYSVMFSHLLASSPSNDSKPSLLERRLSRMAKATDPASTIDTVEPQSEKPPDIQRGQTSMRLRRSLSVKIDRDWGASAVTTDATYRPRPIMRSQTEPLFGTSQKLASSPVSRAGSTSHSDNSLPATPTTLDNCNDSGIVSPKKESEPTWNTAASLPVIVYPSDDMGSSRDHSVDLEEQIVQVSVARQVSINRARSKIRRTVSTRRPNMVNLAALEKNRKSEVGILDSDDLHDAEEQELPNVSLIKELS